MSEEPGPLPRTWSEAIPYVVWGVLILGFGLEFVGALVHEEWLRAIFSFAGLGGLMAMALHWKKIRSWAATISPNWVVGAFALLLLAIILTPFAEQRKWPLSNSTEDSSSSPSGRHLSLEQRQKLLAGLNTGPATLKIEIFSDNSCEECRDYAEEIEAIFKQVPGWLVEGGVSMFALAPEVRGIQLRVKDHRNVPLGARIVGNAMNSAGIAFDWFEGGISDNSPDAFVLVVARKKLQ